MAQDGSPSPPKVRDARLAKFLVRFSVSARESARKDVAGLEDLGPEATWPVLRSVLRMAAWQVSTWPDRVAMAEARDPPHPSYEAARKRLHAQYRNARP